MEAEFEQEMLDSASLGSPAVGSCRSDSLRGRGGMVQAPALGVF